MGRSLIWRKIVKRRKPMLKWSRSREGRSCSKRRRRWSNMRWEEVQQEKVDQEKEVEQEDEDSSLKSPGGRV